MLQLEIMKKLDQGTFSKVYLARDMNNNKILALKKIDEKILSDKGKNYLLNEIKILRMFNHPNIIKLYFVLKKPNFTYLGIEYCNGGSLSDNLYDYIKQHKKPFPEKLVQKIMKQILAGVKCLHEKGIIHRDLKLKNILIYYDNDSDLKNHNLYGATIKIIDFNTSYILNSFMPYSVVGTPLNMAPSIAQNMFNAPKPYDDKIDIWSLGTLCYEMLFGKPLLPGSKKEEVYQNILNKNFYIPKTISVQARMFLLNMLRKDGINRLCASELLNHEFITLNYHNFKMYNLIKDNTKINNNIPYFNEINNNYNNNNNNYRNNNLIFKRDDNNKINIPPQNNIYPFNQEKCNGCGEQSFHFIFYKCMECADVIYCQKCYNQFRNEHTHKFQKIKKIIIKNQIIDIPRGARSPKINKNKKLLMRNGSDNNFPYMNTNPQNNHQCQTFQNYNNNASYI
jgi:serine/threonine protein kinase